MRTPVCVTLAAALTLSACAERRPSALGDRPLLANPSAVAAAEIAFARAALDKGQWTAFRQYAEDDATMFVPERVRAKDWLKGRADPPRSVAWQPHAVYMSCDGAAAVSTGAWQRPDGTQGYFTTVWRRQRGGDWRWTLDHGDALASPREAPIAIKTRTASCDRTPPDASAKAGAVTGAAADRSLTWSSTVAADGSRRVSARLWTGSGYDSVIDDRVAAETGL